MGTNGEYLDCYVAFLDILGFSKLVEHSVHDTALLHQLSGITTLAQSTKSGIKTTSLGPCTMQVRAFSDSIVIFAPTAQVTEIECNPLAQLCFLVRYLHDRILELNACFRGGITIGKMYWHPSWSKVGSSAMRGSRGALPITFGPGLIDAYHLENQKGKPPRVLVSKSIQQVAMARRIQAAPFAENVRTLQDAFRTDPIDGIVHLDLLSSRINRSQNETLHTTSDGFTITWNKTNSSSHSTLLTKIKTMAETGIAEFATIDGIRLKYEWLLNYCEECAR